MICLAFNDLELSREDGNPVECFLFLYNSVAYTYTSSQYSQTLSIDGGSYVFTPEYINRGDSLKLGDSSGNIETCTITVNRRNPIAMLYQGTPPEDDSVLVKVYKKHGDSTNDFIIVLQGTVSQVRFFNSDAELTITIENVLNRDVPRGTMSYYCQNCIYDNKCRLLAEDYAHTCYLDIGKDRLTYYSSNLLEKPDGYFTDGFIKMGNIYRAIHVHHNNYITIKYPIPSAFELGSFIAYPGCQNQFSICAERFNNTDNFSGVPYIMGFDPYYNPVSNRQVFWIEGNMVIRDTNSYNGAPNL